MTDYNNPNGKTPLPRLDGVPGISLPGDFALESADRSLVGPASGGSKPPTELAPVTDRVRFPSRDITVYGQAIARLIEPFSGPGFNLIFRPHSDHNLDPKTLNLPGGDLLELNLTHELWTFPTARASLGEIPNRVSGPPSGPGARTDVILRGIPYTQLVRDVTDTSMVKGTRISVDRLGKSIDVTKQKMVQDIHFEPGLLVHVPNSAPVSDAQTISRMASIPHGTTINAQGAAAIKLTDGKPPAIPVTKTASTPFSADDGGPIPFGEFDLSNSTTTTRLPQDMKPFLDRKSIESITQEMALDPNFLINQHNVGKQFSEVITFTVTTTPSPALGAQACPHLAAKATMEATTTALNTIDQQIASTASKAAKDALSAARTAIAVALPFITDPVRGSRPVASATSRGPAPAIGTANIAFLDGVSSNGDFSSVDPNARTGKVSATFWISTVVYTIEVKDTFNASSTTPLILDPIDKDKFPNDTVPRFVFPLGKEVKKGKYKVEATQVQYSQTVNLTFNGLVWPHISVATLIPVQPILVNFAKSLDTTTTPRL